MKYWKRYLALLTTGLFVIFFAAYQVNESQLENQKTEVIVRLGRSIDATIASLDASIFRDPQALTSDPLSPEHALLEERLTKLGIVFSQDGIRGIYAMRVGDQEIRFIADSASRNDPWHSEPGVVYKQPPVEIFKAARSGRSFFAGPYTDEYGSYYSIFKPVFDSSSTVIAVLGADIESSTFDQSVNRQESVFLLLAVLVSLIYGTTLFFYLKLQELLFLVRTKKINARAKKPALPPTATPTGDPSLNRT